MTVELLSGDSCSAERLRPIGDVSHGRTSVWISIPAAHFLFGGYVSGQLAGRCGEGRGNTAFGRRLDGLRAIRAMSQRRDIACDGSRGAIQEDGRLGLSVSEDIGSG